MKELELDQELFSIALSRDGAVFWSDRAIALPSSQGYDISIYSSDYNPKMVSSKGQEMPDTDQIKIVYIDTPKTILIPSSLFEFGSEAEYLSLHNLEVGGDEQLDISKPIHGTVALMISHSATLKSLGEQFGKFIVASPLQYNLIRAMEEPDRLESLERRSRRKYLKMTKHLSGEYTLICVGEDRAYISIFDSKNGDALSKGLLSTDIIPIAPLSTVGYYLERLDNIFGIGDNPIYLVGSKSQQVLDEIKPIFRSSRCV